MGSIVHLCVFEKGSAFGPGGFGKGMDQRPKANAPARSGFFGWEKRRKGLQKNLEGQRAESAYSPLLGLGMGRPRAVMDLQKNEMGFAPAADIATLH